MKQRWWERAITSAIWGACFVIPAWIDHLRGKPSWIPTRGFGR